MQIEIKFDHLYEDLIEISLTCIDSSPLPGERIFPSLEMSSAGQLRSLVGREDNTGTVVDSLEDAEVYVNAVIRKVRYLLGIRRQPKLKLPSPYTVILQ